MRKQFWDQLRATSNRVFAVTTFLCGIGALGLLTIIIGWNVGGETRVWLRAGASALLSCFVTQEIIRLSLENRKWPYIRTHKIELLLALGAGTELLFGQHILQWLGQRVPTLPGSTVTLIYLAATQLTLVILIGLKTLRQNRFLSDRRLSPGMVFILSFAFLILGGTLLLKTPQATTNGISWIDALFTATSAVCVTGLTVVDTASAFTGHGQWVILGLIQVGGLGVMTLTYFFAYFFAGGVSLRNRIALQDLLSEENLSHIGTVLGIIVGFTFATELIGALLIHAELSHVPGAPEELAFFAIFHSISAFCNAGFSTLPDGLANTLVNGNDGFLLTIISLIVIGSIGFPVMKNLWMVIVAQTQKFLGLRMAVPPRLTANSRLVLVTTLLLLFGGMSAIMITEFVMRGQAINAHTWVMALFHSTTTRTAGFNIVPTEALTTATATVMIFLMFVGGSPSSTAGGIKTTTLAVAFLALRRILFGRPDIEAYGRRLNEETANRALSIIILAVAFIAVVTVILCILNPHLPAADLAFETVSAVSTVGLTRNITPQLGDASKWVIIASMFVGRVGVLTFVASLLPRPTPAAYRLPETSVVLS